MNRRYLISPLVAAVILMGAGTISFAAKAPASKAKAPVSKAKPKVNNTKLGAIGTVQLPGEWCEFNKAYTLGKANPLNVTLKSAEYTLGHVKVGKSVFQAKEDEKLLVIHYTLHNPVPREQAVNFASIQWTAVDAKDKNSNQEYLGVGVEDGDFSKLDQRLKQAQKIQAYAVIRVHSEGEIPKLMAARVGEKDAPVARYDLRGKVKPLDAPYADPEDKTGATVAKKTLGVLGNAYITGAWMTKVEKVEFVNPPLEKEGYKKGEVYVLATLELTYSQPGGGGVGGSGSPTYGAELEDTEGVTYKRVLKWLTPNSNRSFDPKVEQGEPVRFKIAFSVPKGTELKSLTLKEFHGYPLVIDLGGLKAPE